MITVRFLGVARSLMGAEVEMTYREAMTVGSLLEALPSEVQGLARRKELTVIVNGADISVRGGFEAHLEDGDEVVLLPLAHGG